MHSRKRLGLFLALCTLLVAACAPAAQKTVYNRITDAKLKPGDTIPVPSAAPLLTVNGAVGVTNSSDSILMDRSSIESLGLVDYTMTDPFDNQQHTFRGVLMSDLLNLWKVPDSATAIEVSALDDYTVKVPISDLRKYPVIFALQEDGQDMPVSTRGPAMLVYPYKDFPDLNPKVYNDYWVWQIKSMTIE
jgi:hypothetical protein